MKKIILTILFLTTWGIFLNGQNLVPNPSFENYSICPSSATTPMDDQVIRATGWSSYRDTPDYYNTCATSTVVGVPSNNTGFQFPHTGDAYCGGATYNKNGLFREIIGIQLSSPLTIGQRYYVSFYTTLSGKSGFNFATNNIGVKFTTSSYNYISNPIPVNNFAHINYNAFISDTLNWQQINGSFIADSNYSYVAIGNFFDDSNTDTACISNGTLTLDGYYYLDDVCVSTDSLICSQTVSVNENLSSANFKIYPNPFSSQTVLQTNHLLYNATLIVKNYFGQTVKKVKNLSGRIIIFHRDDLPSGLYFIRLTQDSKIITTKKIVIVD